MSKLRVRMILTDKDRDNLRRIKQVLRFRNAAQAVSFVLSFTAFVIRAIRTGGDLVLKHRDGSVVVVKMAEIERARGK